MTNGTGETVLVVLMKKTGRTNEDGLSTQFNSCPTLQDGNISLNMYTLSVKRKGYEQIRLEFKLSFLFQEIEILKRINNGYASC